MTDASDRLPDDFDASLDPAWLEIAPLPGVTLESLNECADLLTRVDRKYVIDHELLRRLLHDHADRLSMLDIGGRRSFRYSSLYFDTPDRSLHRAAATGRRHRVKVRTRVYEDAGTAMLEVKAKDGRGRTVKHRCAHDAALAGSLGAAGSAFVDEVAGMAGLADTLAPVVATRYRRSTLVDLSAGTRATIDTGLVCAHVDGRRLGIDQVIVETKAGLTSSDLDRWLWTHGARPERISKYCTSLAVFQPELPANRWHRTIARYFAA
jgi:hypothetical protein